jgi:hypothetical protein
MTHKETAYAQILLSAIFLVGYFVVLYDFTHGKVTVGAEWKDTIQALLAVLTTNVVMIVGYWFSRQRDSTQSGTP